MVAPTTTVWIKLHLTWQNGCQTFKNDEGGEECSENNSRSAKTGIHGKILECGTAAASKVIGIFVARDDTVYPRILFRLALILKI
jgi:hypothetical protein